MTCGECRNRLLFHYKYNDINESEGNKSKYVRCNFRPKLRQKRNSCPKWCPLMEKEM